MIKELFLHYSESGSHVNTLVVEIDKLSDPTSAKQEVGQIPSIAKCWTARNFVGRWLIRRMWKSKRKCVPALLAENGSVLTLYVMTRPYESNFRGLSDV